MPVALLAMGVQPVCASAVLVRAVARAMESGRI
jgi:hypothetical protein